MSELTWQRCMGLSNEFLVPLNERLMCLPQAKEALQAHAKNLALTYKPALPFALLKHKLLFLMLNLLAKE